MITRSYGQAVGKCVNRLRTKVRCYRVPFDDELTIPSELARDPSGAFEGVDDGLTNGYAGEPLALPRDGSPGGDLGARLAKHVVDGVFVRRPVLAVAPVILADLPALVGIVLALVKASKLLFLGDVQEELDDDDAVVDEHLFE